MYQLVGNCFATSYYNFISDHKSIALRIGVNGNKLSKSTMEKLHFDRELHLKMKKGHETDSSMEDTGQDIEKRKEFSDVSDTDEDIEPKHS